ncbi:Thioesterase/thiol ester dehydrase-isomerase [Lentinula aciculospora]|uniref:Thioesterase/thiol ester dehydrase-isomerase n=1 Tax=Lentinula aciculospora TaxID=153920 RepID=A0A9W9DQ84_9AGAR|nr:Thioesterase/thiol ester dehydrase-isomerase [Lentinula aciculospora]
MYLSQFRHFSSLHYRCAARRARFTTSPPVYNSLQVQHQLSSAAVKEETQDVTAIDSLLSIVKLRVDPRFGSIMPMRIPSLWAEARLAIGQEEESLSLIARSSRSVVDSSSDKPPPRNMHDSYTEFVLPFASDPNLLEEYVNAAGGIRTGKLMEHLDSLAGSISYKHVLGPTKSELKVEEMGLYIVTAGVERIDMLRPLTPGHDLRLSGQVIYTGRSSMEVVVRIEKVHSKETQEKDETILLGRFSMVCRNARTNQAYPVSPLIISTKEDKALFSIGQELKQRRASLVQRSLSRVPPSSQEAAALHEIYLKFGEAISQHAYGHHKTSPEIKFVHSDFTSASQDLSTGLDYTAELVPMDETRTERCMLMFPQERNVHQKIFGGYLMRLAYELGFSNASMFCRGRVRFLALDEISFKLPVPIGSILRLDSVILYDDLVRQIERNGEENVYQLVHVGVKANVIDIKTGTEKTTNEFRFTWRGEEKFTGDGIESQKLRKVVPKTYRDAILWLEARRAVAVGDEIRDLMAKRRETTTES